MARSKSGGRGSASMAERYKTRTYTCTHGRRANGRRHNIWYSAEPKQLQTLTLPFRPQTRLSGLLLLQAGWQVLSGPFKQPTLLGPTQSQPERERAHILTACSEYGNSKVSRTRNRPRCYTLLHFLNSQLFFSLRQHAAKMVSRLLLMAMDVCAWEFIWTARPLLFSTPIIAHKKTQGEFAGLLLPNGKFALDVIALVSQSGQRFAPLQKFNFKSNNHFFLAITTVECFEFSFLILSWKIIIFWV